MVWSVSRLANWVLFGNRDRQYIDLNTNLARAANVSILQSTHKLEPELVMISLIKFGGLALINEALVHNLFEVFLVVGKWLLNKLSIFDDLLKINGSFSKHFVAFEEIPVI